MLRRGLHDFQYPPTFPSPAPRGGKSRPGRASAVDLRVEEDDTFQTPRPVRYQTRRTVAADGADNLASMSQSKKLLFETPRNVDITGNAGCATEIGSIFNRSTFSRPTTGRNPPTAKFVKTPALPEESRTLQDCSMMVPVDQANGNPVSQKRKRKRERGDSHFVLLSADGATADEEKDLGGIAPDQIVREAKVKRKRRSVEGSCKSRRRDTDCQHHINTVTDGFDCTQNPNGGSQEIKPATQNEFTDELASPESEPLSIAAAPNYQVLPALAQSQDARPVDEKMIDE